MCKQRAANLDWLKGEPEGIQMRTGKLTGKAAVALATEALRLVGLTETRDLFGDLFLSAETGAFNPLLDAQKLVKALPPPLVRLRQFESTPGLWVFDDTLTGIIFLMWSDEYKVHPWKGTSYEVLLKTGQHVQVRDAAVRFFRYLRKALETSAT